MKNTNNNNKKTSQGIANPTKTIVGRIIIWVLVAVMVILPTVGLILQLTNI